MVMIRFSVEVVHGIGVLRKFQGNGTSVLIPGRLIRPAGGFSQLLALPCPHGADQTAGLFLIRLGGAVRADFPCADVVDLVRFLDVRSVGCGQVIDGPYAVSCPAVPYMCGGSVDIAEEDRRTPRVGALPSASDAQDVDQRVVVPALEPGGALVGSVAHEQPEGVIPRIVDSTTLAYEEFGIPDAAVGGEGRREQHLELCGWHVLVLISPEESGLAVLGENRACGFRQYVQLHVSILSRRVCGEASGVLCLDPLFLLWRDCGAGWILAGAVRSSMLDDCDSSGMEGARFLPRLSRYAVLVHVADHVFDARGWGVSDVEFPLQELVRVDVHPSYGCFGCEGVHAVGQWFGVVEVVLGVRFGHPPRVHRAIRGHGLENHHGYILPRHVRANDRGNSGKSPDYLLWRGCIAGLILAGAVASSLHPTSARRRVWGGARFLPRSSRYAVLAHAAGHVCGRVHSGVIPVARTHVLATGITVAPYSRLVSMLQAWMRAGLRVIVSPSPPVTSTVSPVRAPAASSSCNDSGSVSSARGLLRCGSHVMSSMLMVVSFPATFVASDRWNLVGSDYFAVVGSRDRSYPCRFRASSPVRRLALVGQEETRFLPRSSRYTVVAYAADHADGRGVSDVVEFPLQELVRVDIHLLYGCLGRESGHTVRQWFGVVEAVPGVRFGHLPRVNGAVRGHGFENDHNHNSFPATFMASIRGTVGISPGCFRCGGMAVPVVFLAGTVASSPASGDCYSSGVGEARFLPRFAWYAVPARAADHVCGVWLVSYWFV